MMLLAAKSFENVVFSNYERFKSSFRLKIFRKLKVLSQSWFCSPATHIFLFDTHFLDRKCHWHIVKKYVVALFGPFWGKLIFLPKRILIFPAFTYAEIFKNQNYVSSDYNGNN